MNIQQATVGTALEINAFMLLHRQRRAWSVCSSWLPGSASSPRRAIYPLSGGRAGRLLFVGALRRVV